jgi:4-hydroxy-tetrahydrodipicolinate synthase
VNAVRAAIEKRPVIPALKAILAHHAGDPGWEALRPPLVALASAQREALLADLAAQGFEMPGLGG